MNCFNHPEVSAAAYCRTCGKALCESCRRTALGTIYCDEHVPATASAGAIPVPPPVPTGAVSTSCSPGLALGLGFIPGVGAIYNGQYAKGLVHAIIFGLLISIHNSGAAQGLEPLFGMLTAAWVAYMAFEAYHTARKRRAGETVDEFSSLLNLRGQQGGFPTGAVTLIVLGIILLLNTLDVIPFRYLLRYWPILLILIGLFMLYARLAGPSESPEQEVPHDRH